VSTENKNCKSNAEEAAPWVKTHHAFKKIRDRNEGVREELRFCVYLE